MALPKPSMYAYATGGKQLAYLGNLDAKPDCNFSSGKKGLNFFVARCHEGADILFTAVVH